MEQHYKRGPYKKKPKCKQGHPLYGPNLHVNVGWNGHEHRECITCRKERDKTRRGSPEKRKRDRESVKRWKARNPEKYSAYELQRSLRRYGLSAAQYAEMLAKQGGVCAICRGICKTGRRLAVDHDHVTGEVRGLLCTNCNQGVGYFQNNEDLLMAAQQYLNKTTLLSLLRDTA